MRLGAAAGVAVAIAIAMAAPVAWGAARATAPGAPDAPPAARDGPASGPLVFAGIPWGSPPATVARRLASRGYRATGPGPGVAFRGRHDGLAVECAAEYGAGGGLIALTLRFDPSTTGDALRLYVRLVEEVRRRHGPWLAQVDPARPGAGSWPLAGRPWRADREPAAATMWVSAGQEAAAVQLDERHVVWLRYEASTWEAEHRRED